MHFAEELTLSIGSARPLTLEGGFLPIPGPSLRLPGSRFALLGWSSTGSGMQAIHVFLLGVHDGAVRRLAYLTIETDRPNSALLVRHNPDGSLVLGLPRPPAQFLHNEDEWSLVVGPGGRTLSIAEIRRLTYKAVAVRPEDLFYSPPFQLAPRPTSVSWIAITPQGFSLARARPH